MQKIVSLVVVVAVLLSGFVVAYAATPAIGVPVSAPLPVQADPLPVQADPLPVDLSDAPALPTQTVKETVIVVGKAKAKVEPIKVWTCGAPRGLASDESGTVRDCEWK